MEQVRVIVEKETIEVLNPSLLSYWNGLKSILTIKQDLTDTDHDNLMERSRRLVRNKASHYQDGNLSEEHLRRELQHQMLNDKFAEKNYGPC